MTEPLDDAPDLLTDQLLPEETVRETYADGDGEGGTYALVTDGRLLVAERSGEGVTVEAVDLHSSRVVGTTVLRGAETGDRSRYASSAMTGLVGVAFVGLGVVGGVNPGLRVLALFVGLVIAAVSGVVFVHSRPSAVPAGVVVRYADGERRWTFGEDGLAVCEAVARVVAEQSAE